MEARTGAVGAPSAAGLSVFDGIKISGRSQVVSGVMLMLVTG